MTPPLFTALFDDAAMFPPASLPMDEALRQHAGFSQAWYAACVGPLVCAAPRLGELRRQTFDGPLAVAVTVPDGVAAVPAAIKAVRADDRLLLRAVEVSLAAGESVPAVPAVPADVETYAELPWDSGFDAVMRLGGARAKFRTGGAYVPSSAQLAGAIAACVRADVPFKLTAGLHHAVRQPDSHGFLNVLLAAASPEQAEQLLELADETEVVARVRALPAEDGTAVRSAFRSFGTCSVGEPIADLVRLGLAP